VIRPSRSRKSFEVRGEAEDGHDLRSHGDVEAVLPRNALGRPAEADHDLAQGPVVHVQDPLERHPAGIDVELVALEDVVVHEGHEGIVRRGDGVEVAGEVQVDLVHRQHLGVAAAGGAALHAQDGAERGFAQRDHHFVPGAGQGIGEPDRRGGLAFARRGGGHRRDQDHFAAGVPARPGARRRRERL
jgi:hypothetical protein